MSDRKVFRVILGVSLAVFVLVVLLYQMPKADHIPDWVKVLPTLNALINGTCTILLLTSLAAIRGKHVTLHKRLNITTFCLSGLFLVSYIIFHSFGVETAFPKDNPVRPAYLFILISHIVLAAAVLPLVLTSLYLGLGGNIALHRRVSRFTFPIWLYVTFTGVVVYLMISPYYRF